MDRAIVSLGESTVEPGEVVVLGEAELGTSTAVPDDWPKVSAVTVKVKVRAAADSSARVLRELLILFLFLRMIERWICDCNFAFGQGVSILLGVNSGACAPSSVDEVRFAVLHLCPAKSCYALLFQLLSRPIFRQPVFLINTPTGGIWIAPRQNLPREYTTNVKFGHVIYVPAARHRYFED